MSFTPAHITPEDLRSRTWEHVVEEMTARLQRMREENDSFSDHDTTTKRRGRLAELKEWLDLAKQAQHSDRSPHGLQSFQPTRAT